MKQQHLYLLLFILLMNSCRWNAQFPFKNDTLIYKYKLLGLENPSSYEIDIKFPYFLKQDSLNHVIARQFSPIKLNEDSVLKMSVKIFREAPDLSDANSLYRYYFGSYFTIIHQDSSLITFKFDHYINNHGPNGNVQTKFINWDTGAQSIIKLDDILTPDYKNKLTKIAASIFRADEKLSDTVSLSHGYTFKNNQFALNNNFSITPVGLKFLYNQYEIKPYSAGQTSLLVPYSKIKSLLLPHTVVTQYIK